MGPKETTDSIGMPCVSRSYHRLSIGSTSKFMLIFPCRVFLYKLDGKKEEHLDLFKAGNLWFI